MKRISLLRQLSCATLLSALLSISTAHAAALKVVATLPTFASLVSEIGGDSVAVTVVAAAQFNPHFIEPRPSDVLRTKRAELFVHGGLDLEAWREPLLEAAGNPRIRSGTPGNLDLSIGVPLLEVPSGDITRAMGDIHLFGNPHIWLSPENGVIMARSIASKLSELRPEDAPQFKERLAAFSARATEAITDWKAIAAKFKNRDVVAYHNEWAYLAQFAGLRVAGLLEPKPGIPPSPRHLEELRKQIVEQKIPLIIQSSAVPTDAAEQLKAQTGVTLKILCQSVDELPECSDYLKMVAFNMKALQDSLS